MFSPSLLEDAETLLEEARQLKAHIVTAESCTGGLIASLLTAIAGSSDVLLGGWVSYANAAKTAWLGIPETTIQKYGAVSEEVANAMSAGAINEGYRLIPAELSLLAVAVTGVAGPGGGSEHKPVGTVHVSVRCAQPNTLLHKHLRLEGGRNDVRMATIEHAVAMMRTTLREA